MYYKVLHSEIKSIDNPNLARAFHYGDGFFESIYVENDRIPFYQYHYQRICKSFDILKLDRDFLPSSEALYDKILSTLLVKNTYRIRLDFTREAEGLYGPDRNDVVFAITHKVLEFAMFSHSKSSYKMGIYNENIKAMHPLSAIKSKNALVYVLASIWAKEHHFDDAILLNQNKQVCECISSNIFVVKDKMIYTPPIADGSVDGVMRAFVIDTLKNNKYDIREQSLSLEDVRNADEVFVTNAIQGIQAVRFLERAYDKLDSTNEIIHLLKSALI